MGRRAWLPPRRRVVRRRLRWFATAWSGAGEARACWRWRWAARWAGPSSAQSPMFSTATRWSPPSAISRRRQPLAVLLMRRLRALLTGSALPPPRTGADATATVRGLLRLRLPRRAWLFDDLSFVFVWTAAVDATAAAVRPALSRLPDPDLCRSGRSPSSCARCCATCRAAVAAARNWLAGGALALAALARRGAEGPLNLQSLAWCLLRAGAGRADPAPLHSPR